MPSSIETTLRNALTDEQYAAAADRGHEVLTLACAGSGKSRTLAFRIARLIAEGADPRHIVAFTFTEKAAESIKLRVAGALQAVGLEPTILGAMYLGTIHSYCQNVLGQMDAVYRQYEVLDENRLILFLISRYPQLGLAALRSRAPANGYFHTIRAISDAWKTLNDEMADIQAVTAADPQLGDALTRLRDRMQVDQYIDFSMMIRLVAEALQRGDVNARRAVAQVRHLMVDEYQDVNPAQEALVRELHSLGSTLFVVGDDDQAIYGWRGANVNNILTFEQRYPSCSRHTLSKNFRSTRAIVSAADGFIAGQLGALRITKTPQANDPAGPRHFGNLWFTSRADEAGWVIGAFVR